jgi:hypothetical protein
MDYEIELDMRIVYTPWYHKGARLLDHYGGCHLMEPDPS